MNTRYLPILIAALAGLSFTHRLSAAPAPGGATQGAADTALVQLSDEYLDKW